ncbi:ankyrin repeat-containing domain protein [Mycena metata]|uniref:Ankyrin repeat-containing domain protein n=1 Tax=Mycena metata TaxID=1033252 RepID=A0AAD7J145_9AGAR|nr:ankyrin repeat-containing domain protein [Mycena metata]
MSLEVDNTDFNARSINNRTALHMASFNGHVGIVKFLLEKGVDVNVIDKDSNTALLNASDHGHTEVVGSQQK